MLLENALSFVGVTSNTSTTSLVDINWFIRLLLYDYKSMTSANYNITFVGFALLFNIFFLKVKLWGSISIRLFLGI